MAYEVTTAAALLEFDTQDFLWGDCVAVDANHFLIVWQGPLNDGFSQIITVNTTTWAVTTAAASFEYENTEGATPSVCAIDTNHFVVFSSRVAALGRVSVLAVNTTTWAITTASAQFTHVATATRYNACAKIDANHFINLWRDASADGRAQIFTIDTTTFAISTAAATFVFDTDNAFNKCIVVDTNHVLAIWQGQGADGFAQVLAIDTTTWAVTTAAASLEFDTQNMVGAAVSQIDTNHFLVSWQGGAAGADQFVQVLTINTTTWAVTTAAASLNIDTQVTTTPAVTSAKVDTNHFVIVWGGAAGDGFSQVITVNTTTWAVTTAAAALEYDTQNGAVPTCARIDGGHFINFWQDTSGDGIVQVLNVNVQQIISLSQTITVVSNATKTPGKNISQAITITGAVATIKTLTKALTEQIVIVASVAKTPGKFFTQAIVVVDGLFKTIGKNITQAITITDIIANVKGAAITLVQGITVTGSVVTSIVRNIILTESIVINAVVTFLKKARGFILGRNTDTNIMYGKKKNMLGRNNDTNIMYGKKLK